MVRSRASSEQPDPGHFTGHERHTIPSAATPSSAPTSLLHPVPTHKPRPAASDGTYEHQDSADAGTSDLARPARPVAAPPFASSSRPSLAPSPAVPGAGHALASNVDHVRIFAPARQPQKPRPPTRAARRPLSCCRSRAMGTSQGTTLQFASRNLIQRGLPHLQRRGRHLSPSYLCHRGTSPTPGAGRHLRPLDQALHTSLALRYHWLWLGGVPLVFSLGSVSAGSGWWDRHAGGRRQRHCLRRLGGQLLYLAAGSATPSARHSAGTITPDLVRS